MTFLWNRILRASLPVFCLCTCGAKCSINGVMVDNQCYMDDGWNDFHDSWIELNNTTSPSMISVGMFWWYFCNKKMEINSSVFIPANGYVLLYLDESENIPQHATFRLDINGSTVFLTSNDGSTLIDSITYIKMPPNLSYGRTTNGKAWFKKASPGKVNVNSDAIINNQLAPVPEFSLLAGVYKGAINVSLSLPAGYSGLKIYYTTDGSEPNDNQVFIQAHCHFKNQPRYVPKWLMPLIYQEFHRLEVTSLRIEIWLFLYYRLRPILRIYLAQTRAFLYGGKATQISTPKKQKSICIESIATCITIGVGQWIWNILMEVTMPLSLTS